jgi:hypothetical protein
MKIHLYGNILNNGYNLTAFLRQLGDDATLFLDQSSPNAQDYPWWEDAHLDPDQLPDWIRYYRFNPQWFLPGDRERRLFADFGSADLALVCGWGPILAGKSGIPFVFYSYGEDLNMADTTFGVGKILRMTLAGHLPHGLRKYLTIGLLQRKYLRRAEYVAIAMTYQKTHLKRLGLLPKMAKFRLAWDISRYGVAPSDALREKYAGYDKVFFMIARHSWRSLARDLKGNDKFIRAFARYLRERSPITKLVLIDKGHDVGHSRALIQQLGIASYVEWVTEMNKDGIRAYLSLSNLVAVDQFWHDDWHRLYTADRANPAVAAYRRGNQERPTALLKHNDLSLIGFGSASIEALSAGRPLITSFFEHDFYDGEEPPIFNAFSETEIYDALLQVDAMTISDMAAMGQRAKDFVVQFHSWSNTLPMFTLLLERAYSRRHAQQTSALRV